MNHKIYQIDAFADAIFSGNPAAVCPLNEWLDDAILQKIAMENNLAETAFYVQKDKQFEIRWFTPTVEVDLCGHATLAAAYVLFNLENYTENSIEFFSHRSGILTVQKNGELLTLNFPSDTYSEVVIDANLIACFESKPQYAFKGKTDYMLVFEKEEEIIHCKPNLLAIAQLAARGIIISSEGRNSDFVSRFFAPQSGINEDPVTGSAHTTLTPYWAKRLGKNTLKAVQLSDRKGNLVCKHFGERVEISGTCKLYLSGTIFI